jgi:hypothetical protein
VERYYPKEDDLKTGTLVIREDGEFREFLEEKPGFYGCDLDETFLQTGLSFMIHVITPDGFEYESDFDSLRSPPD